MCVCVCVCVLTFSYEVLIRQGAQIRQVIFLSQGGVRKTMCKAETQPTTWWRLRSLMPVATHESTSSGGGICNTSYVLLRSFISCQ